MLFIYLILKFFIVLSNILKHDDENKRLEHELLTKDINDGYTELGQQWNTHKENLQRLRQIVLTIANNWERIFILEGKDDQKQYICSKMIRDLKFRGLQEMSLNVYEWLKDYPQYKQTKYDASSPDNDNIFNQISSSKVLANKNDRNPNIILIEEFSVYSNHILKILDELHGLDDRQLLRGDIQVFEEKVADLEVKLKNICSEKKIALISDAKKDDWQERVKKPKRDPIHIKRDCPEGKDGAASNTAGEIAKIFYAIGDMMKESEDMLKYYPPESAKEDLEISEAMKIVVKLCFGAFYNEKMHESYRNWCDIIEKANQTTISHAAQQSESELDITKEITLKDGSKIIVKDKRGITKEGISNFIDPETGYITYFKKWYDSIPSLVRVNDFFNRRLKKRRRELVKLLEPVYHHR